MYSLVQHCAKRKDLIDARRMQCLIIDDGHEGIALWNDHLIRLFADCGSLNEADRVFCKVVKPTVFTWNAIVSAHEKLDEPSIALELYERMQENGVLPDVVTYLCILKACGSTGELDQGRMIHGKVTLNGLETDVNLGSTLISMYSKCACLKDGRHLFDTLLNRNAVTWGAMIAGYMQNAEGFSALKLFECMQEAGVEPSIFTYSSTLKACGSVKALYEGKILHDDVVKSGYELDSVLGTTLISMYVDCGRLEEARRLFKSMLKPDVVSWDILLSGHVANGQSLQALDIYREMQESKVQPNMILYLSLLQACGISKQADNGRSLHNEIIVKGLDVHLPIQNTLIYMYANCGFPVEALELFVHLAQRDVVSWGALITGYVDNGFFSLALEACDVMVQQGILPNRAVFLSTLKACGNDMACWQGRLKHKQIINFGLDMESAVGNALVDMYVQLSCLEEARRIFDNIPEVDELSWGLMLAGYANDSQVLQAFELFDEMVEHGLKPNKVILLLMLTCCSKACAIRHGRQLHMHVISIGFHTSIVLGSAVVDMYSKCGNLKDARKVFDGFPCKDIVLYGSMIDGYARQGHGALSLKVFVEMDGKFLEPSKALFLSLIKASSSIEALEWGFFLHHYCCEFCLNHEAEIGTSLLDLYAKCGYLEESRKVFDELELLGLVSWSAIISGCVEEGQDFAALELYAKMQEKGVQADIALLLSVMKACVTVGAIRCGRMIHGDLVKIDADSDSVVRSRLCNMYADFGMVEEFSSTLEGATNLEASSSCASKTRLNQEQGNCKYSGVQNRGIVKGLEPMESTVCSNLAECSHAGMLREACCYFNAMTQDRGLRPSIQLYSCMVDLLGRTGHLGEAEFFVKTLPLLPDFIMWISLLTSSKTHMAFRCGRQIFQQVGKHIPDYCAGHNTLESARVAVTVQCRNFLPSHKRLQKACLEHNIEVPVPCEDTASESYSFANYKGCPKRCFHEKGGTENGAVDYDSVTTNNNWPHCGTQGNTPNFPTEESSSGKISDHVAYAKSCNSSLVSRCVSSVSLSGPFSSQCVYFTTGATRILVSNDVGYVKALNPS